MRPIGVALWSMLLFALPLRAEPHSHWAYRPVVRPPLPAVNDVSWPRNPIDYFILARMEATGLAPSPPAANETLLRRVTFDLTGLPAAPDERRALAESRAPDAYEQAVDRLLHSPRYGERMATHWLDLARYADTHGYHIDSHRDMWRYRDEVIASFNRHQPFDEFTIEQLAGDLLPGGTLAQKIASGFNRNHMINFEMGAIPEEYLNEYVVDRVVTTSTVWLGQTMQCAQCHDHKYDPISMREFYSLYAFFNNVPEEGLDGRRGNAVPWLKAPTRLQQLRLAEISDRETAVAVAMQARGEKVADDMAEWESRLLAGQQRAAEPPTDALVWLPLDEEDGTETRNAAGKGAESLPIDGSPTWLPGKQNGGLLLNGKTSIEVTSLPATKLRDPLTLAAWIFPTTKDTMTIASRVTPDESRRGIEWYLAEGHLTVALVDKWPDEALVLRTKEPLPTSRWQHIVVTHGAAGETAPLVYINGEPCETVVVREHAVSESVAIDQPLRIGRGAEESGFRGMLDDVRYFARALSAAEIRLLAGSDPVASLVAIPPAKRTAQQQEQLRRHYLEHFDAEYQRLERERQSLAAERRAIEQASPTTMVMAERSSPASAFVLERGSYELPGERVTPNTPGFLPPLPEGAPRDRLTLARWLVNGKNPLTARVAVNRLWQLHFGHGLVRTPEDFGTRGEPPTHPELLDWLADELVASGWNLQHIQRLIVTSATYRQSSVMTEELRERDPENRLYARYTRQRLPAEMIRDQALFVSGLLSHEMYGPGVFPYQPAGLWEEIGDTRKEFSAQSYKQGSGADLYRRSLYTFWKRSSPPPNMALFDAPDRETCTVQRGVTSTPMQALVLWNDPLYIECARTLAARMLREPAASDGERLQRLFDAVMGRTASDREIAVLHRLLVRQRGVYRAEMPAARQLLDVGDSPVPDDLEPAELASWTFLAHTLLNVDEAITRN